MSDIIILLMWFHFHKLEMHKSSGYEVFRENNSKNLKKKRGLEQTVWQ